MPTRTPRERRADRIFLVATAAGLALGGIAHLLGVGRPGDVVWAATTVLALAPTAVAALRRLAHGTLGVDIIAVLAMGGALALHQLFAGAVIAVMLTGGTALERFAVVRARRDLTALLARAPRVAHRRTGEVLADVEVATVAAGDLLVVKPGEVIPVDGVLASDAATLDESALTGEARPVDAHTGARIRSGATNLGPPLELRATASAAESTYEAIIRLVREAETSRSPFVRLADRYATRFLFVTLVLAGGAWLASGDPIRALAVLVVATPCPLILAAPAAVVAGVSRAARHGIIVKGGAPLEALGQASVLLLDKTGTITAARPRVVGVETFATLPVDQLIGLAASLEQVSLHPYAPPIVAEAHDRRLELSFPRNAREELGAGITGEVAGHQVAIGRLAWAAPGTPRTAAIRAVETRTAIEGSSGVFIAVDGQLAGAVVLEDPIRAEAPHALAALRKLGITRIHMVTGDHPDVAELVGDAVGVDQVFAERAPEEKVGVVLRVRAQGMTVMVGDGVNDAPALALADVGVAMGARGATAASEAADVVLTADRLEGLVLGVRIARHTRRVELQSVYVGMLLSLAAMVAAALGHLPPVVGAVLQEVIDLAVIVNALRALGGRRLVPQPSPAALKLAGELEEAHRTLRPQIEDLAVLATRLDTLPRAEAKLELERADAFLRDHLLPHETDEQGSAYRLLTKLLRDEDPTGPLVQTHHEIARLARLYSRLVSRLPPEGPEPEDLRDLRRALYGLHAVLSLHFAQEEDVYLRLSG